MTQTKEKYKYEITLIVRPNLPPQEREAIANGIADKIIKEFDGSIAKAEYCGLRDLAYPIKKNTKGYYIHKNVVCNSSEAMTEIRRVVGHDENVLRFLAVRVEEHNNESSPLMAKQYNREEIPSAPRNEVTPRAEETAKEAAE